MVSKTIKLDVAISASTEKALKDEALRLKSFREDPDAGAPSPENLLWKQRPRVEEIAAQVLEHWAEDPDKAGTKEVDPSQEEGSSCAAISVCISKSVVAALEGYACKLNKSLSHAPASPNDAAVAGMETLSCLAPKDIAAEVLRAWALCQAAT